MNNISRRGRREPHNELPLDNIYTISERMIYMKKKNAAAICAAAGVCVLTSAAFASYQTANGYDSLKKSLIGALDYTNCTISGTMEMKFDDLALAKANYDYEADLPNQMIHSRTESSSDVDGDATYVSESYEDSSHYYYNYTNSAGEQDGFIRHDYYPGDPATNLLGISNEDRGTFDKVVRFMELAADTVVGDLRNNFVCTEDTDDHTSYSITLDSVQIPEIINAGLSMVFSVSASDSTYVTYDENGNEIAMEYDENDGQYYINQMGTDPTVDTLTLNFTTNKDGTYRDGNAEVIFKGQDENGNEHKMTITVELSCSNVGTTVITPVTDLGVNIYEYDDDGNIVKVN